MHLSSAGKREFLKYSTRCGYVNAESWEAGEEQTWLAVAVAKGTLVADVEAADTLAGVAPCIMGTWREDITQGS